MKMYEIKNNDKYYMYDIDEKVSYFIGDKRDFLMYLRRNFMDYKGGINTDYVAMNINDTHAQIHYLDNTSSLCNKSYIFYMNDYRILNIKDYEQEVLNTPIVYKTSKRRYKKYKYGKSGSRFNDNMRYKRALTYQDVLDDNEDNKYKIKHRKYFYDCIWDYIEKQKRVQASWKGQTKHKCQFRGDRESIRKIIEEEDDNNIVEDYIEY